MSSDVVIELTPKQSQFDRQIVKTRHVLYGGAKGGGKSHGLREIMVKRRIEQPGSIGVIFRKTWPEILDNHIEPLLSKFQPLKDRYVSGKKQIEFENGSILMFRHCQKVTELEKFKGREYHDLAIEEVGDWPEDWFWTLKGSNRSARPGIVPRWFGTGNPGGIGHKWLKRLFIERRFRDVENPNDFAFIPATVYDNPVLMHADPGYVDTLKMNKNPDLVKAYLHGSWDIMAGQFFENVSRETHMVRPFDIPDYWQRVCGFDTGYNHPAVMLWGAVDTDGNVYIYRELCVSRRRSEEIAHQIMTFNDCKKLGSIAAGWDCWTKHGGGPSVEEKFSDASQHQIVLHKASIDRIPGAQQVRDYLAIRENGPRLRFTTDCPITFDCITRMTHDPNNPEDVLKVDATDGDPWTGDDPYDALRHLLMDRPRISVVPDKQRSRRDYYGDEKQGVKRGNWKTV